MQWFIVRRKDSGGEYDRRGEDGGRERDEESKGNFTHAPIWTPFNSSSTSSSVIFSPSCVSTYLSSPAPMNPFPSLSNTWKPRINSSMWWHRSCRWCHCYSGLVGLLASNLGRNGAIDERCSLRPQKRVIDVVCRLDDQGRCDDKGAQRCQ